MKIDYQKVVREIIDSRKETGGIDKVYFAACGGSKAGLTPANFIRRKNLCSVRQKRWMKIQSL